MSRLWLSLLLFAVTACSAKTWSWQDLRTPSRSNPEEDLASCRSYAASQYRPGIPAGSPYLHDHLQPSSPEEEFADNPPGTGSWQPDREPFPLTTRNGESVHGVIVLYTGYPGELDYHPGYLDALVEKCMADHGWAYRPATTSKP